MNLLSSVEYMLQTIKSVQSIKRKTVVRQTLSQTVLVVEKKYDEFSFIARKMKKKKTLF